MAQVLLKDVNKKFDEVVAVKNINLDINDKEFVVFVGPSGCGKTTTLRMIAGLEEITSGTIQIGDRIINDVPPKDRNIAMVFQNYALYPHMNVYDNMAFGLKIRKHSKAEIERRVEEAAEILDLNKLLNRLPKQLSGGQRQRVALGRAIVRHPQVFLMDEPLSNLDAKLRVQMRAQLKKLHERLQTTIIYVTHDQVEAMTLGSRIAVILNGELQQVDSPINIYENPSNSFVGGFIGSPPMTFIKGKIKVKEGKKHFECSDFELPTSQSIEELLNPYVDKDVMLGLRPEYLVDEKIASWVKEGHRLEARVNFRELMGSETYLYLHIGSTPIIARVDAMNDAKEGSIFPLVVRLNKLHFFDTASQKLIV